MTHEDILRELLALPPEAQREVEDFILRLRDQCSRQRPQNMKPKRALTAEEFVGMWRDRKDLKDSSAWVREHRTSEWVK